MTTCNHFAGMCVILPIQGINPETLWQISHDSATSWLDISSFLQGLALNHLFLMQCCLCWLISIVHSHVWSLVINCHHAEGVTCIKTWWQMSGMAVLCLLPGDRLNERHYSWDTSANFPLLPWRNSCYCVQRMKGQVLIICDTSSECCFSWRRSVCMYW